MSKKASKSSGEPYECIQPWPEDCSVQCGGHGIVLPSGSLEKVLTSDKPIGELAKAAAEKESYTTAFFEAFPKTPSCFIRGEGKSIEEAEEKAYEKFKSILNCKGHDFESRGRKDGYGYCKYCSLSMSGVLPILNKCCKCNEPTNWTTDDKGRYYCKKHARVMPKSKDSFLGFLGGQRRNPRKLKKILKKSFAKMLLKSKGESPRKILQKRNTRLVADSKWSFDLVFGKRNLIKFYFIGKI